MSGEVPLSMSGTCGCILNGQMYIFGGCGDNGQTNEVILVLLSTLKSILSLQYEFSGTFSSTIRSVSLMGTIPGRRYNIVQGSFPLRGISFPAGFEKTGKRVLALY